MARLEIDIDANIKDLKRKLDQVDGNLNNTQKSFTKLQDFAIGALSGIAAAFSISAITQFGRAVLDTTAKFQRFEAVLTNTLGSSSEAQIAMQQITDFASRTPFAVDELTAAFVKLANQGFKPTANEMTSLGDLASSTGKSFDQLAEAIIDAQVGEFERLKEFGIRASKEGDRVTFTFKGVQTQVENTDKAIRGYVLSLGDAEGVSGAMAGISETLGGKLSNLGDNIEQLKLAIGDQTSGVFATSIDWLNEFVRLAGIATKSIAKIKEEVSQGAIGNVIAQNREEVLKLAQSYRELNPDLTQQAALAKAIADVSRSYRDAAEGGKAFKKQSYTFGELKQINEAFIQMSKELLSVSDSGKETAQTFEEFSKLADIKNEEVFARWTQEADDFNATIAETQRLIKGIEDASQDIVLNPVFGKNTKSKKVEGKPQEFQLDEDVLIGRLASIEMPPIDTTAFEESVSKADQAIILANSRLVESARNMKEQFRGALEGISLNFVVDAITEGAFAIGQALAEGTNVMQAFGKTLLNAVGSFLSQLGKEMVAYGTAALAMAVLTQALSNPYTAIPAAIGLIAAGAALSLAAGAIQGTLKRGANGSGGGGNVSTGAASSSFTGSGIDTFGFGNMQLTSVVKGTDILLSLERTQNKNSKG